MGRIFPFKRSFPALLSAYSQVHVCGGTVALVCSSDGGPQVYTRTIDALAVNCVAQFFVHCGFKSQDAEEVSSLALEAVFNHRIN